MEDHERIIEDHNRIKIDWDKVDRLIESGNDGRRVAGHIGVHYNTLYRRCETDKGCSFSDYLAQKRARGESLLIAKQYEQAMKGNTSMLIWVGKQMCGQKDKHEYEHSGKVSYEKVNFSKELMDKWDANTKENPVS